MKTTISTLRSGAAALALSIAALTTASFAQTTATTVPVGFMSVALTNNTTTSVGLPLQESSAFRGPVAAFTTNTIQASGVTWVAGQFSAPASPYFVAIKTGLQTGRVLLVTGNDSSTLTLQTDDTGLDAAGFSLVAGTTPDSFELFPGDTLGTLFGSTVTAGVLPSGLQGGTSAFNADGVQLHNGVRFVTYFFNTTVNNWVFVNGGSTSQNDTVLFPDKGLLITRRGPNSTLTLMGSVPDTALMTKLPGGSTAPISVRFPTDTTLGTLNFTGPGTWISTNSPFTADTISIWSGIKWVPYYKNLSNQWIKVNGDGTDQSATAITAGSAVLILKRGTASGSATFFTQALPYSL